MKEFKGIRRVLWDKYCALPRFSFLLNRSDGVGRWENKSGGWNDTHEVSQLIESAQDEINEQCDKLAEQAQEIERLSDRNCAIEDELARNLDYKALCSELRQEIERLTAELEQVKKAPSDHSEHNLEVVPPAIPATQVLVERELLERVERYFSGFVSDQQPAYALGSKGLATIRAILSSKGGDV